MSGNLFDDNHQTFLVLANDETQYSLWPETLAIPAGWQAVFGPDNAAACQSWLNNNWTDLRPSVQHSGAEESLYQRFQQQVAQHPDNIALSDEHRSFSYLQLEQQVCIAAEQLYAKGVTAQTNVALLLPKSCEFIIQLLATLRLGACYVPIDPDYPKERVNWILASTQPKVLVSYKALNQPELQVEQCIYLDDVDPLKNESLMLLHQAAPASANATAYIIFTSGTTGNPKGVMVGHQQVLALLDAALPKLEARSTDVWPLFHSTAFDVSVWELWGALTTGAKLVIVPKSVAWSAEIFSSFLREHHVSILNQTPSAFYALIDAEHRARQQNQPALTLRKVVFAGEALSLQKLQKWWQLYPMHTTDLINMYGITETTVHASWLQLEDKHQAIDESPIGKSLPSLELLLLDQSLQPIADGQVGEIYVAGKQLAYGYINRPDLTAARFIASPFHPGQRLYRSGDLATQQAGELNYLGRADRQLKIRGFRIEPDEIETVLESHPAIQRAVVLAKPCATAELPDGLLAFLISTAATTLVTTTELRDYVAERMPKHYLPSAFVFIDSVPLTINGKLDQKSLLEQWRNKQDSPQTVHQKRMQLLRARQQTNHQQTEQTGDVF